MPIIRTVITAVIVAAIIVAGATLAGASSPKKKKKKEYSFNPIVVEQDSKAKCLDPVKVVGSQDIRLEAAEDSAKKAWSEHVRWESGEAFMDISNSIDYKSRCSRSSVGEALGAVLNRCEISASPCRPTFATKNGVYEGVLTGKN